MKTSISWANNKILRLLLPLAFWLGVWWAVSAAVGQQLLVPSPAAVARRLAELAQTPLFWRSTGVTLLRIFGGALGGCAAGTLCAWATCRFPLADVLLSPALRVVRATPVASFILLLLLWIRTGLVPGCIAGLMALPVVWESVRAGIRGADPLLLELGRAYRFGRGRMIRLVYLPALRPHLAAGVCTAIGLAWKSGVAAEVLCLPKRAIGTQVYYSKLYLETPSLFAWTITVVVLSLTLEALARRLLTGKGENAA